MAGVPLGFGCSSRVGFLHDLAVEVLKNQTFSTFGFISDSNIKDFSIFINVC